MIIGLLHKSILKEVYKYSQFGFLKALNSSGSFDGDLFYVSYYRKQTRQLQLLNAYNLRLVPLIVVWLSGLFIAA